MVMIYALILSVMRKVKIFFKNLLHDIKNESDIRVITFEKENHFQSLAKSVDNQNR